MNQPLTYAASGVDYTKLDPFKLAAQEAARETAAYLKRFGVVPNETSRGESAFLIWNGDHYLAHVEEGLGTKNLVADAMHDELGTASGYGYRGIAIDTAAMILNDLITVGALPISLAMHLAVGDDEWLTDTHRVAGLVDGWRAACQLAGCVWSGGETPALKGIVMPGTVVLSGSAVGRTKDIRTIHAGKIKHGDAILILESSGPHANGLSMIRKIAATMPDQYETRLSDGRYFGDAVLEPTHIYVQAMEDCLNNGIDIHYAVNVTGHGWRKFMRAPLPFRYVIDELPERNAVFDAIQQFGPVDDREAYGTFNMGAGFALYVPQLHALRVLELSKQWPYKAYVAGFVENGERSVVIRPKNLLYSADTLQVR